MISRNRQPARRRSAPRGDRPVPAPHTPPIPLDVATLLANLGTPEGLQHLLEALIESAFVMDVHGRFVALNQAAAESLGLADPTLAIGKTDVDFLPPDSAAAFMAEEQHVLTTGQPLRNHLSYVPPGGGPERWLLVTKAPLRNSAGQVIGLVGTAKDVTTEREAARAALQAAEDRYRRLVEEIPVIAYTQEPGYNRPISYTSPQVEVILGYTPEEWATLPNGWHDHLHPDDLDRVRTALEAAEGTGSFTCDYRVRRRDGAWVWLRDEAVLVRDTAEQPVHWQGVINDITAQRESLAALQASEARFRAVWEATSDATCLSDPDGILLAVNPAYCELYGYAEDELIGKSFAAVFPEASRAAAVDAYRAIFTAPDPPLTHEIQIQRRDGTVREAEVRAAFVEQNGVRTAMVSTIRDITQRKRVEAELREAEERFQGAFEVAPIGMAIVALDGRFVRVNPAECEILGYSEDELLSKSFQEVTHPDGLADELALLNQLVDGELSSYTMEKRFIRKDGTLIWGQLAVSLVRDHQGAPQYLVGQLEDVTARKQAEAEVREAEERFRTFFEEIPGLTYIYDARRTAADHDLLYRSHQFGVLTGYPNEIWQHDRNFIDHVVHPDDREWLLAYDAEVETTGEPFHAEYRIVTRDGQTVWVQEQAKLVYDDEDERRYWVGILTDISQQKAAELATAEALARLEASNRELARQNAAKSAFVSAISHEFRTPLTSIQGFSELIAEDHEMPGEEIRAFATMINQSALRLSRLVQDVLDLDQMVAGEIAMSIQPVDLNAVVTTTLAALGPPNSHQLDARLAPALPEVPGDPDRLTQVVTNLVANAIKYAPAGGPIIVTTAPHREGIELTVADQGLGVPDEYRESIFEPYGRIARPEQTVIPGTGLGLPITRQIVTLHGGRVWVEPNAPQGSVFHVVLPVTIPGGRAPQNGYESQPTTRQK